MSAASTDRAASTAAPGPTAERPRPPRLSVVIVTFNSAAEIVTSIPPLVAELRDGDELIVCDNASADGTRARAAELAPGARVIDTGGNLGFGAAANLGAESASGDLLLFLNPDAVVQPGFREAIELPWTEQPEWGAWQGLVTSEGGSRINAWGGTVHFTGIAWASGAEAPIETAPPEPTEIPFASGACLAVRAPIWHELGGFCDDYFLYHEDTDLGLRLWLGGQRVGLEPRARCDHDYEFAKGNHKWFYLERNRWATIIRTYPTRLLVPLLPALLATELALHLVATLGGWLPEKLRADREVLRWMPRLLAERRQIRASASASGPAPPARNGTPAAALAERLTPELDSHYLGRASGSGVLAALLGGYWRLVGATLGDRPRRP